MMKNLKLNSTPYYTISMLITKLYVALIVEFICFNFNALRLKIN